MWSCGGASTCLYVSTGLYASTCLYAIAVYTVLLVYMVYMQRTVLYASTCLYQLLHIGKFILSSCLCAADDETDISTTPTNAMGWENYRGSGGGEADEAVKLSTSQRGLLFVHQEPWQQELLKKYGSLSMIDATYRTTRYDIPLFFIVVPTNVGYTVAAEFCVQSEGADDIAEALQVKSMTSCFICAGLSILNVTFCSSFVGFLSNMLAGA